MSTKAKRVAVKTVKPGDDINTTTGMRTVVRVDVRPEFVAVRIKDPANPPSFETVLDYPPQTEVTVRRGSAK